MRETSESRLESSRSLNDGAWKSMASYHGDVTWGAGHRTEPEQQLEMLRRPRGLDAASTQKRSEPIWVRGKFPGGLSSFPTRSREQENLSILVRILHKGKDPE